MEAKRERKSRVESQRYLAVNTTKILATPAAKLAQNVISYITLDLVGMLEKGTT